MYVHVCISFYASDNSIKLTITDVLMPLKTGSLSGQSIDLSLTPVLTDAAHTITHRMSPWKSPSVFTINAYKWMIALNGALMMP